MVQSDNVSCQVNQQPLSNNCLFTVSVPSKITESFFQLAAQSQQSTTQSIGFKRGSAPISYIQEHFKAPIVSHLKDLGLKFFGINNLMQSIRQQKIIIVGTPQLTNIQIDNDGNAQYSFEGHTPKELYMQSWKYLPFKPTPRKRYRDIDKQVTSFLQEEEAIQSRYKPENGIAVGDWVCFTAWIIDKNNKAVFDKHTSPIWLKIGDEEPDVLFQTLFLGKHVNERIVTDNPSLQNYFCEASNSHYTYVIEIQDIVPYGSFSFDNFKQYFKIKTQKDLLIKITEVFSFNNDISQRRSISHEALKLIIKKNHIVLPDAAIIEQKKLILTDLKFKPDFIIYKQDPNFDTNVTNMAKRQLLDSVVAEFVGYQDNISVSNQDMKAILHITQRPRLKDFLYFPFIKTQLDGQEYPIESESLYKFCLKEKSINHIIHHLTKK
ncbi:MAG: trigger factor [Candidatus Dependentiae bacterium]|nr:trigger factor [Candidatus Dependentiae bacterium]